METPSSMGRATRSQTSIKSQKIKKEGSISRSALVDITNDSPIVGLAMGNLSEKTPASSLVKNPVRVLENAPGSGEDLLRGEVKTLLQKVEEEVYCVNNKNSLGDLIAPTSADVLKVQIFEGNGTKNAPTQVAEAVKPDIEAKNPQECLINRALQFDSPHNSEITDDASTMSSSLTYQGSEIGSYTEKSPEYDSSSVWSLQVNVSVQDEDEEIEEFEEEEEEFGGYEDNDDESFDELCEGLSKMSVQEFNGKHTRFVYNSDDEIEEVIVGEKNVSPNVVVLKGLPLPVGRHLRFHDEEEEEK